MIKSCINYSFAAFLLSIVVSGCTKEYEGIETEDEQNIQAYIRQNNLNVQQYDSTGIYYQVLAEGAGEEVDYTDRVFVTLNEKSIDGQYTSANEFANVYTNFLGYLGPESGLPEAYRTSVKEILKKKGGSIRIIIPSRLAYGKEGRGDIPGNASLDCIITLYDADNQADFEDVLITRFSDANNLNLTKDTSGAYYQIITPGTGTDVITDSTEVTVNYTLRFLDGQVIPQPGSDSYKSKLSDNIQGFQIGVGLLKKGGKLRLLIPSRLAYGPNGSQGGGIPPNTILDYDIELLDIVN